MSIVMSSGNTSVTGAVNSTPAYTTPSTSQTPVMKSSGKTFKNWTAGTGELLHTVTAGKILYVTAIYFNDQTSNNDNNFELRDGTTIAGGIVYGGSTFHPVSGGYSHQQNFPTPLKFTAGVFIDVRTNTAAGSYSFSGWEE